MAESSKDTKRWVEEAARARTGLSLLALAQETLEAAKKDGGIHDNSISAMIGKIGKLRAKQLARHDKAVSKIL